MAKKKVVLAVHGGAGVILRSQLTPEMETQYRSALEDAMAAGHSILSKKQNGVECGKSSSSFAVEAAEAAVRCLEDCPLFNAGRGSVFGNDGKIRMDAAIMACTDSSNVDMTANKKKHNSRKYPSTPKPQAGSVAGVECIKNPISLARAVMERTSHVMLIGEGAEKFAKTLPDEVVETRPCEYFWTETRLSQLAKVRKQEQQCQSRTESLPKQMKVQLDHAPEHNQDDSDQDEKKFGTVGCVVSIQITENSHSQVSLASATSTGGMTNQRYNRVGDSPLIGAGTYANHLCAISCTGHGEHFIRCVAAHDIAKRLEYKHGYGNPQEIKNQKNEKEDDSSLQAAVDEVVFGTLMGNNDGDEGGQGGVIALDRDGNFIAKMNCPGMYHGWVYEDGTMETRIFREECTSKDK